MPPLTAVALVSAAALGFEVLLVRMLSIAQWHHFAHMIISLALLGYGASGTAIAVLRDRLIARPAAWFAAAAALFGTSALLAFAVSQAVPLNVLELAWDWRQWLHLLAVYLLLAVPFFFAATAVGLALTAAGAGVGRVYRSDLLGAGAGALGVIGALFLVDHETCLKVVSVAALLAALLAARRAGAGGLVGAGLLAVAALAAAVPDAWIAPRPSPYKGLSMALTVPDAEIVAERSGPLGWLAAVRSPTIPFRHAPGLGLLAPSSPPEQLGVFTDAGGMTAITRFDGDLARFAYLDHQTAALPYHLRDRPRVLILGAGGGSDVLLSRYHAARTVDAVEINPQLVALVRDAFRGFAGDLYRAPGVAVHVDEARSFVRRSDRRVDLITIALLDSFTAASAGLHALNESALYTVEAFESYLEHLEPGAGLLAVTRWLKVPPRDSLKLVATAAAALERRGIARPDAHLALIRGWSTATLVVAAAPLSPDDIAAVRRFCAERGFDIAHLPGLGPDEANRRTVLERAEFYEGASRILGPERARFFEDYRFDVRPATDDRPYFFHFLKPRTLIDLLGRGREGGLNLVEWAYPALLATIVQALLASIVLVLLPLSLIRRPAAGGGWPRFALVVYFAALGLAFLFIEMAFIQRFQLFLGHPLFAVAVTLAGFLVFAGIGSGLAERWAAALGSRRRGIAVAVAGIAVLAVVYLAALPLLLEAAIEAPRSLRIALALALVAPLGVLMGLPFPLGLADAAERSPALVPWAWGVNGCASVLSAALAVLLAIHFGFAALVAAAVLLYALAALTVWRA